MVGNFVGQRGSVLRRPGLENIGDIGLLARKPHRLDDVIELSSCSSNEWPALSILIGSRGLAHEHQISMRGPFPEDRPNSTFQ